jgi:microcompartment protein CcmK/EutM
MKITKSCAIFVEKLFFLIKYIDKLNNMRHVTVYTTDKEYNHFIELTQNLHYVKKIETDDEPTKKEILDNIKAGLEEMKLIKKGKLKTTPLNDFLNEL